VKAPSMGNIENEYRACFRMKWRVTELGKWFFCCTNIHGCRPWHCSIYNRSYSLGIRITGTHYERYSIFFQQDVRSKQHIIEIARSSNNSAYSD